MGHQLLVETVKLGRKGQVTIPKAIREEDNLKEKDVFTVTHMPGCEIILRKSVVKTPEEKILHLIRQLPSFDAKIAWKEVLEERKREDR